MLMTSAMIDRSGVHGSARWIWPASQVGRTWKDTSAIITPILAMGCLILLPCDVNCMMKAEPGFLATFARGDSQGELILLLTLQTTAVKDHTHVLVVAEHSPEFGTADDTKGLI